MTTTHQEAARSSRETSETGAMRSCIDSCNECSTICTETIAHSLQMGGRHATAEHIRTLLDCSEICQTAANFMARGSELHTRTCASCAEACSRCAESCEQLGGRPDERMKACAEVCRRCARECQNMASTQ